MAKGASAKAGSSKDGAREEDKVNTVLVSVARLTRSRTEGHSIAAPPRSDSAGFLEYLTDSN